MNVIKKGRGWRCCAEAGTFCLVTRSDMLIARETFMSRGKWRNEVVSCFQKLKMSKQ